MAKSLDLKIEGMTCGHCEMSVTKELAKLSGAKEIAVSAANGSAHLIVDDAVATNEVAAAVEEAGYKLISK
jgi:copper chaperone CopZ